MQHFILRLLSALNEIKKMVLQTEIKILLIYFCSFTISVIHSEFTVENENVALPDRLNDMKKEILDDVSTELTNMRKIIEEFKVEINTKYSGLEERIKQKVNVCAGDGKTLSTKQQNKTLQALENENVYLTKQFLGLRKALSEEKRKIRNTLDVFKVQIQDVEQKMTAFENARNGQEGEENEVEYAGSLKGQKGDAGNPGTPGLKGMMGSRGEKGQKGEEGHRGLVGAKGENGSPGIGLKGDKGDMGNPGTPGTDGLMGSSGEKGQKGETGNMGLAGAKGQKGSPGTVSKGDKGDVGTPGAPGRDGPIGSSGEKGQKGVAGDIGLPGAKGPKGTSGFGLKGDKGDVGNAGAPGIDGLMGSSGEKGQKGETGNMGLAGAKGQKGSPGTVSKGDKGDVGTPGAPGRDGSIGSSGEKGEKGEPGARGLQGAEGPKGAPGFATDCVDVQKLLPSATSGVYPIRIFETDTIVSVYCDMDTDGGGWTVFQRRFDGSVDFYRTFKEYENGFGDKHGEFWLGLKTVQQMTQQGTSKIRIEVVTADNRTEHAIYTGFKLLNGDLYELALDVESLSGTISDDLLKKHVGSSFSTKDRDLDRLTMNCAKDYHGAWWYHSCTVINLNGFYELPGTVSAQYYGNGGIIHRMVDGHKSLKETKMMFRRI